MPPTPHLDRDDGLFVDVIEAQPQHGALRVELLLGAIKEIVLLLVCRPQAWRQQLGDTVVRGAVGQPDLDLDLWGGSEGGGANVSCSSSD